ncbi:MAG: ATP synthase F1 subunit delta [Bacteroidota bacterium]
MKGTRAALRYAKATLDLAKERGLTEDINKDMKLITSTISESDELGLMLKNPIIKSGTKKEALNKIFGSKVNSITIGVINLLIENNRLELLELVAKEYNIIYDHLKGVEVAQVTTAIPLTKELEKKILAKVKSIVGKEISLNNIVDPDITGGFILRVGDKQLDSSISGMLNTMLEDFEENQYISKL